MAGLNTKFNETNGRITWQTTDENGDTFSLTLGPTDTQGGLYMHVQSNGSALFEYSLLSQTAQLILV